MNLTIPANPIARIESGADLEDALATLGRAFRNDPAIRWLFPEDETYPEGFAALAQAFAAGETLALQAGNLSSVAFWKAPGVSVEEEEVIEAVTRNVPSDRLDDAFVLFERMGEVHPSFPHWYLPLLGSDPEHQGKGLGSSLLREVHDRCDRSGTRSYLESSSAANLPFYRKHGYRVVGELRAGTSPVIYPMLRHPVVP